MDRYIKTLKLLGRKKALDSETAERLLRMSHDGGPGSGNYGHAGRPGKVGGSMKTGSGGKATGSAGKAANGTVYSGKDFSLRPRGLRTLKKGKDGVIPLFFSLRTCAISIDSMRNMIYTQY